MRHTRVRYNVTLPHIYIFAQTYITSVLSLLPLSLRPPCGSVSLGAAHDHLRRRRMEEDGHGHGAEETGAVDLEVGSKEFHCTLQVVEESELVCEYPSSDTFDELVDAVFRVLLCAD